MLQVISLETNHVGEVFPGSQREVREYLEERGYVMAATVGGKILLAPKASVASMGAFYFWERVYGYCDYSACGY